jgi:hypothetical protein
MHHYILERSNNVLIFFVNILIYYVSGNNISMGNIFKITSFIISTIPELFLERTKRRNMQHI